MTVPAFETLIYAVDKGIATLTLNRPEKLNAFTTKMMAEMIAVFDLTDADDDVRAVIVTGAGRAFCAGADLAAGAATFDHRTSADPIRTAARVSGGRRDGGGMRTTWSAESLKPGIAAGKGLR